MPTSSEKFSTGYKGKAPVKAKTKEVAGPYRSQSSVPKIRNEATPHEHRSEPTTVQGVERKAARQAARTVRAQHLERRALRTLRQGLHQIKPPVSPTLAYSQAKYAGIPPPAQLRTENPAAFKKAEKLYFSQVGEKENLGEPEDITHAIEAASLAAGGIGAAKLAVKGIESGAGALLARDVTKAASSAPGVAARLGEKSLQLAGKGAAKAKALPKQELERLKTAPKRTLAKVKAAPKRIKETPKTAKRAVTTKAGRKAAAKSAARHPVRSGYGAAAVSPVPLPGELDKRARAFAEGTAAAVVNHPSKVAETTLHGALGAFTAPLAVAGAGIQSAKQGNLGPLGSELTTLGAGTLEMGKKLASGNPKTVEKTTLQETGLIPFIPVPHVLRRVKGTKAYEDTRGAVRAKVESKRSRTRTKRIAAEKKTVEHGGFIPRKKAKGIRQSVADTRRPGEHYALRRTGKLIEKQRSRHWLAREVSRMERQGELSGKTAAEQVSKPLRKSPGTPSGKRPKKAMALAKQNDADALAVILKHGLPLDERTLAFAERLKEGYGKPGYGDVPAGTHLDRHSVQWIIDHPEMFQGKRGKLNAEAVKAFDAANKPHGTSLRHQYLAQVDNLTNPILKEQGHHPILKPEEMITPEMVKLLPKRDKPWNRSETLDYVKELRQIRGVDKAKAQKRADAITHAFEHAGPRGEGLMKPPEHGGAQGGVSTTRAVAWTPEMAKAFANAARRENSRNGLREPSSYIANKVPSGLKGSETASALAPGLPLRKVWPSRGLAAKSGNAVSDYESLIHHSLEAPHSRKATVEGLNRIFDKASRKIDGKRYLTGRELEKLINTHQVPDGTIFVRTQFLKSILEGEVHVSPEEFARRIDGEVEHGQKLAESTSVDQIHNEMLQAKASGVKGEKYSPMDAAAIHELMGHIKGPGAVSLAVGKATNRATSLILNSPAFEASQFIQEGVPGAAALGRNVINIPRALRNLKEINKLPAEDQGMIRAVVGSGAGVRGAPSLKALRSDGYMDPIRAAGGKQAWRHALEILNGDKLNRFDRSRGGIFREIAAGARVEGDFRRASKGFNAWRRSTNNLFKGMEQAVNEMRGMTPTERQLYVASHPKLADRLTEAMNGQMGNWNSFTVFEKQIAPFAIFYNFQRYAVLWTLYHFPLDHPVVATALASLGAVNAQQINKLAAREGGTPNALDYTKPVINGQTVLPAGQRFFSGLTSVSQAALEGKPAAAIGGLSPALSIPLEAVGGKNTYTNQPIEENGWLFALRQAGNLSPFLRFTGAPKIGQTPSPGSQVYHQTDPFRTERSFLNPLIGQSAKQFGEEKKLEKEFQLKYGAGKVPYYGDSPLFQKIRYGHEGSYNPNPKARKRELASALREIHATEGAASFIKRKEEPFYAPSRKNPKAEEERVDKEIREAFQNAYQSGPNAKPEKESNPFGIPGASSTLEKSFGIESTSPSALKKRFGIE